MGGDILSKTLLNDILQNINSSIAILRKDFKKLHELVITLSVRVDETRELKGDLKDLTVKIDSMTIRLFELEKSKDKLEYLIREVENTGKSSDTIAKLTLEEKIKANAENIGEIKKTNSLYKKFFIALTLAIGVVVYVGEMTTKFIEVIVKMVKSIFL